MQRPKYSLAEKMAMLASVASIFIALLMFEVISPTYRTVTSLIFNNGVVIILFIIGTYWAFGRDVQAFMEHQNRIYVFSRIITPVAGLIFFGENLATYVGTGPVLANFCGIITCLLIIIFGAIAEIHNEPKVKEIAPVEKIATQELHNIQFEQRKKKIVRNEEETTNEYNILVH